jgi:hypothetical protein
MVNRLFPAQVANTYYGGKLALWLFAFLVLLKVAMGVNSIFNGHSVASSADGIPLDTFTPAGAQAIVSMFAAWGVAQLTICVLCILILARYRILIPFMFALLLMAHLGRRLIFMILPIEKTGTTSGFYVNLVLIALLGIGLAISLCNREGRWL